MSPTKKKKKRDTLPQLTNIGDIHTLQEPDTRRVVDCMHDRCADYPKSTCIQLIQFQFQFTYVVDMSVGVVVSSNGSSNLTDCLIVR